MTISKRNEFDARNRLEQAILMTDNLTVYDILTKEFQDISVYERIDNLIIPVLEKFGEGWEKGDYSLSQVYMSGRICEEVVDVFLPPTSPERVDQPLMAIVTLDDFHVLGKRIVYSALRASGYSLMNYGRMTAETLIDNVVKDDVKLLLISTLMLPAALNVRTVVDGIKAKGKSTKVIVGGAPFNYDALLWKEVGADGYGRSATEAVKLVNQMIDEGLE